jgi:hypothetical protein
VLMALLAVLGANLIVIVVLVSHGRVEAPSSKWRTGYEGGRFLRRNELVLTYAAVARTAGPGQHG